jgi:uncharacterized surface protein with fasciclin (FAS1) repeats
LACNFSQVVGCDEGSCIYPGCIDSAAINFNALSGCDDGSCYYDTIYGCTNSNACNYDDLVTADDGSCLFVGDACDDGLYNTENDAVLSDCTCMGMLLENTVWDIIQASSDHSFFEIAILSAGIDGVFMGTGPITVFAPTDEAFNQVDSLLMNILTADLGALGNTILNHATDSLYLSANLSDMMGITMMSGETPVININENGTFINNAKITVFDIAANNGVVHVIDAVLLPAFTMVSEKNAMDLNIYPNPVKDEFLVNSIDCFDNQLLSITDATGRIVINHTLNGCSDVVNVSNLPSGIYTATIIRDGAYGIGRFIKK